MVAHRKPYKCNHCGRLLSGSGVVQHLRAHGIERSGVASLASEYTVVAEVAVAKTAVALAPTVIHRPERSERPEPPRSEPETLVIVKFNDDTAAGLGSDGSMWYCERVRDA